MRRMVQEQVRRQLDFDIVSEDAQTLETGPGEHDLDIVSTLEIACRDARHDLLHVNDLQEIEVLDNGERQVVLRGYQPAVYQLLVRATRNFNESPAVAQHLMKIE